MRFDVVTLFPEMIQQASDFGIVGRAIDNQLVDLVTWNPRDFTEDRHRTVDARPYGGG
ncbi:MAG: tRNA (guanosine(37)-N1)-methyltransferase TrmD, partial [Methylococcales bacterium]